MFGTYSQFPRLGLGSIASRGINWSTILTNTSKTLGVINQAIPAFYQIKPVVSNMKTMFRVAKEVNSPNSNNEKSNYKNSQRNMNIIQKEQIKETNSNNSISFFA